MKTLCLVFAAMMLTAVQADDADFVLVEDGQPRAAILLPSDPSETERLAAYELMEHVRLMSGASLAVVDDQAAVEGGVIRIGDAAPPELIEPLGDQPVEAAFVYRVTPEAIDLRGATPEGTANAVYTLLESLGVRWFMPGELGRVVPDLETIRVPVGEVIESPDFRYRDMQHVARHLPWTRRNRLTHAHFREDAHGFPGVGHRHRRPTFEKHPEWFALIDGQRVPRQMCVSNPELLAYVIEATKKHWQDHPEDRSIGIGPNDGYGYCECEECMAMDSGRIHPWNGQRSFTDRYIRFINAVIEEVEKEYPDRLYHYYIYQSHILPPTVEPNPAIVGITAPINFDRIHGIENPRSLDRFGYAKIMEAWAEQLPLMMERGYLFNLADPAMPFSKVHALPDLMKWTKRLEFIGQTPETKASWASNGPTLYVASKLFWDADADPYAILDDYATKFFGPAAAPMRAYLQEVDDAWRTVDTMVGSMYVLPQVFPPDRMAQLQRWLTEAAALAQGDETIEQRVALFQLNFSALQGFLKFWYARNTCDFATAKSGYDQAAQAIDEQANWLLYPEDQQPGVDLHPARKFRIMQQAPVTNNTGPDRYLKTFWQEVVDQGYERTVSHGEKIVQMPDVWDFLIDPTDAGRWGGWYRDGAMGGNWQKHRTLTGTWSDQGYHYYKGIAWYRTQFQMPASARDRAPLYLWFSGIDEKAEIWLNGEYLGSTDEPDLGLPGAPGPFHPVDFDITDQVRFDQPNTLAVRVTNIKQNEVGTGGITGPVMVWSPRPGMADPLRSTPDVAE